MRSPSGTEKAGIDGNMALGPFIIYRKARLPFNRRFNVIVQLTQSKKKKQCQLTLQFKEATIEA